MTQKSSILKRGNKLVTNGPRKRFQKTINLASRMLGTAKDNVQNNLKVIVEIDQSKKLLKNDLFINQNSLREKW